jgi:hypothetical protein
MEKRNRHLLPFAILGNLRFSYEQEPDSLMIVVHFAPCNMFTTPIFITAKINRSFLKSQGRLRPTRSPSWLCPWVEEYFHPMNHRPEVEGTDTVDTVMGEDRAIELEVVERESEGTVLVRH